jgi:hypothetical protein
MPEPMPREAEGCDVELITDGDPLSPRIARIIGQLQLMGASRLQMTAPLGTLADPGAIGKLVSLGVLHFKTAVSADGTTSDGLKAQLKLLANIGSSFTVKGYAAIRPVTEVVVHRAGAGRTAYLRAVEQACGSAADIITVPVPLQDLGEDWRSDLAACFRERTRDGKWLKMPRDIASAALEGIRDRDAVLDSLERLSLLSRETEA